MHIEEKNIFNYKREQVYLGAVNQMSLPKKATCLNCTTNFRTSCARSLHGATSRPSTKARVCLSVRVSVCPQNCLSLAVG